LNSRYGSGCHLQHWTKNLSLLGMRLGLQ
jgi:hypothetical protein